MKTIALLALFAIPMMQFADAQTILVNETTPCFLNETAGAWVWRECGFDEDYLRGILLPWEWITGGNFSLIIASLFITFSYIKYHKVIYPVITGILFLPVSYFVFPEVFITWAVILAFGGGGAAFIYYAFIRQTKEYSG